MPDRPTAWPPDSPSGTGPGGVRKPVPGLAFALLRLVTPPEDRDSIAGDYEEMAEDVALRKGRSAASAWYVVQILRSLPGLLLILISRSLFMFKTDFKLALRNILKNKGFSFLNVAGLALGMAIGFLMLLYVFQEIGYDRFHEKSGRVFRFSNFITVEGRQMSILGVPGPFGPLLKETLPEVLNVARLKYRGRLPLTQAEKKFDLERTLYADPGFFKIFTTRILQGEPDKMLEAPFSLVLTDEASRRIFGRDDPVGKIVQVNARDAYTITGVIKKMPSQSHLQFDALISLATKEKQSGDVSTWMGFNFTTYLELGPNVPPADVLAKSQRVLVENIPAPIKAMKVQTTLGLLPLPRIHLYSRTEEELSPPGNPAYIRILTLIAAFILLLAGINFVILSTARAGRRAKEVGIRKVLGAERRRLIVQFLGESVLLSVASLAAATGLIYLLLPLFNRLIAQTLSFEPFRSGIVLPGLLGLALVVGLLAGLYPAFVLSGYSPQSTLKSQTGGGRARHRLRHGLVTFQYVISIALICCTLTVFNQLRFLRHYDLGYDKDRLVEFPLAGPLVKKRDVFKAEVLKLAGVDKASLVSSAPMRDSNETIFAFEGATAGDRQVLPRVFSDVDYLPAMGLTLTAGRNFDDSRPTDRDAVILNETTVRRLGWTHPLGKTVRMTDVDENREFHEVPLTVIGVVKDYRFESLRTPLRGQVIINRSQDLATLLVKLRADAVPSTMKDVERIWKNLDPSRPFSYTFQSETFDLLYRADLRLGQVFVFFTLLALFVAGLGLFGLAAFTAERRTKEIGIRKALGASVANIMTLLSRDFVRWVLLANAIAWPVAFLAMRSWIRSFACRADFNPFLFLAAGAASLLLAILTVSLRTLKTSLSNPARALRYE